MFSRSQLVHRVNPDLRPLRNEQTVTIAFRCAFDSVFVTFPLKPKTNVSLTSDSKGIVIYASQVTMQVQDLTPAVICMYVCSYTVHILLYCTRLAFLACPCASFHVQEIARPRHTDADEEKMRRLIVTASQIDGSRVRTRGSHLTAWSS